MALAKSIKLFNEARKVMVEGVNSPVRSFLSVGGNPLVIKSGKGARLTDVDGNQYIDYCMSWGASILGHAHKDVTASVQKALQAGTSFGTTTPAEIEIAHFIVKHVPSVEMVRFVNSGTEAAMSAIRLARGFTQRNMVVKFDGCYHGHADDLLIKAGSGVVNLKASSSLGIPENHIQNTLSLPYNDMATASEILGRFKNDIACVIIEPVAGNMGVIPSYKSFLKNLRDLTKRYNIILIFDEIINGFRTGLGCVQSDFDVIPDMTCLGKIIGGGFPVGAYGGRKDIMEHLAPKGGVYQAGTFSGNPVVMNAGLATLKKLNTSFYKNLNGLSDQFSSGVNFYFQKNGIPCFLSSYRSMMSFRFSSKPVLNYDDAVAASSKEEYKRFFHHLLKRKIYFPPADLESFFISGAHTKKDLDNLFLAIKDFFKKKKK